MQRLPFGRFMGGTIFTWAIVILLHCVCTTYASLMVIRFLLGAFEAVIVPAIEITLGMFFTRTQQSLLQPYLLDDLYGRSYPSGFHSVRSPLQ